MRRLLLRPGAVGDCILALPALKSLATHYTEVWTSSLLVPLIQFAQVVRPLAATGIDLVGVGDLSLPSQLKKQLQSFDSIVSWYGSNRPEFREALEKLGPSCKFLPALPPDNYAGHAAEFFAGQVGAPKDAVPKLDLIPGSQRNSVVIHPFSGGARKNWPLAAYRALAERIDVASVEWTAGPEEKLTEAYRFENLAELAGWLGGARLYIGNDSGITHLAAAVGMPTLALFGPTDPTRWAPRGANVTVLRFQPIERLPVDAVLEAVNRLLRLPSKHSSSI